MLSSFTLVFLFISYCFCSWYSLHFRNCDSTFGLGDSKENELDWFSSADNIGGSGDVMDSDFMFSNPVENVSPDNDSSMSYSFSDSYASFVNEPGIAHGKEGFIPKAQVGYSYALIPSFQF